jgi:magnesium transporter
MPDALERPQPAPVIDCAAYCGGVRVADVGIEQIRGALEREDQFVWLGLYEPEEETLRAVPQQFGLHDLAVEDAYNAHQRPKLELYEDSVFVVLRTAHMAAAPRHLEFGETHVFLGRNYVVTVRHGSMRSHIGVRQRCESTPQLLAKGPGYVLYALMDFVVDQYLPIVQQMEEEVEDLEDIIFGESANGEATARVYRLKRDLLALRRTISPLVEVCNRLMRFELSHIPEDTRVYFRDVISDAGLSAFPTSRTLSSINLAGTAITDKGLAHLQATPALKSVNLSNTKVTPAGLAAFKAARPEVQVTN